MTPTSRISNFEQDPYKFLSNFYYADVLYQGLLFRTSEHAYQAAKSLDESWRIRVQIQPRPHEAKKMGRTVPLRPDWEKVKLQVMEEIVEIKFSNPELRRMLLATGDAVLEEGNWWGDRFWGICRGEGENHLGKILMKVRDRIRKEP